MLNIILIHFTYFRKDPIILPITIHGFVRVIRYRCGGGINGLEFIPSYQEARGDPVYINRVSKSCIGKVTFIWEERIFPDQGAPAGAPSFLLTDPRDPFLLFSTCPQHLCVETGSSAGNWFAR
jgi:hypothetical protein